VRLSWPALKRGLDELQVATLLGKRASILAHLQQIVPQFTYAGCDRPGIEDLPGDSIARESTHEVPAVAEKLVLPYPSTPLSPWLGPLRGGSGD